MSTPQLPASQAPTPASKGTAGATTPVHTPFDAEEAAAAAALDTLPVQAPSPELDARVLAMARAALSEAVPRPRPQGGARTRRRSPALWWLGSAAGAVMAAGIGWQLGGFADRSGSADSERAAATMRAPGSAQADADFEVLMIPRRSSTGEADHDAEADRRSEVEAHAAERMRLAPLQPPSRAQTDPTAPSAAATAEPSHDALRAAPAPVLRAPAPEAAMPGLSPEHQPQESLDQITVTGTRISGTVFPPVVQDFRLAPDAWIERIRARRDSGDGDAARRSLVEFVRANPQRVLPRDLRELLKETP